MSVDAKVFFESELPQKEDQTLQHNAPQKPFHKNSLHGIYTRLILNKIVAKN